MKAFLLAAGLGTRLRPLTDQTPKCLLPVRGVPLLEVWLEICRRYSVDEVLVNLYSQSQKVRDFLAKCNSGMRVRLFEEPTLLGSAATLRANRTWVESESSFWVFYADVLTTANLTKMADFHAQHQGAATLAVCRVPDPRRSGIAVVDEGGVVRQFIEKPENPPGNLAFGGILLARPQLLESIPQHGPADLGRDVLPRLVNRMFAYLITDYHLDVGTPESYLAAQTGWPGLVSSTHAAP
ncbi:MAG TPA: nucleotidyltransferase family protein [Terriglobia bacterium]|nr:nucleotidyltransferase family protein [Terriglobia bacterium]